MSKKPDVEEVKEEVESTESENKSFVDDITFEETKADTTVSLSCTDTSVYTKNAPVEESVLKEIEEYRSQYLEDITKRATDEATSIFKSDKKVDRVIVTAPYTTSSRGNISVNIDREKSIRLPGKGNETITKPKITTIVNEPYNKVSKRSIYRYEQAIAKALSKNK